MRLLGVSLRPVPVALFAITFAIEAAGLALLAGLEPLYDTILFGFTSIALGCAGALVASRYPRNPIGWLLLGAGVLSAASEGAQGWGRRAAVEGWPAGPELEWVEIWTWLPSALALILAFLLFPDGRLLGPRWRAAAWTGALGVVLAVPGWSLSPDRGREFTAGENPFAAPGLLQEILLVAGMTLFLLAWVASAAAVVVRFRRSGGEQRQQLKWVVFAAAIVGVVLPFAAVLWDRSEVIRVLTAFALAGVPAAACVAILRYRLYDIDVVISRTLVYGVVTLALAAAYAATALLLGTALGSGSAPATAVATLVAAIAFRPVRARVQDAVDRRFSRARYDALHRVRGFLEEVRAGRAEPEAVEAVLRDVLEDPNLELLFLTPEGDGLVDARGGHSGTAAGDPRHSIEIERAGTALGEVRHSGARPDLLRQVVEAAGLAIEIVRLRIGLRRQVDEVAASRARIVAAGDAERRRIERDLHDGAQQRLVSIGLALRHAQHELGPGAPAAATLDAALAEIADAIRELRELARGLRPAQLDAGLGPALHELASRAPLPVEVRASDERYPPVVEAAAYFIVCEGLTNAAKHARASGVVLSAHRENGSLLVSVCDDGVGGAAPSAGSGLSGLYDRVGAHGGRLRIESAPASGTRLIAELPCGS